MVDIFEVILWMLVQYQRTKHRPRLWRQVMPVLLNSEKHWWIFRVKSGSTWGQMRSTQGRMGSKTYLDFHFWYCLSVGIVICAICCQLVFIHLSLKIRISHILWVILYESFQQYDMSHMTGWVTWPGNGGWGCYTRIRCSKTCFTRTRTSGSIKASII